MRVKGMKGLALSNGSLMHPKRKKSFFPLLHLLPHSLLIANKKLNNNSYMHLSGIS